MNEEIRQQKMKEVENLIASLGIDELQQGVRREFACTLEYKGPSTALEALETQLQIYDIHTHMNRPADPHLAQVNWPDQE